MIQCFVVEQKVRLEVEVLLNFRSDFYWKMKNIVKDKALHSGLTKLCTSNYKFINHSN